MDTKRLRVTVVATAALSASVVAGLEVDGLTVQDLPLEGPLELEEVIATAPDLIVLEGNLHALPGLRAALRGVKLLVILPETSEHQATGAILLGAHGTLLEDAELHRNLSRAVGPLLEGELWAPRRRLSSMVECLLTARPGVVR